MKKYFLSIVAMAAMLFATSCQESLVEPQMEGTTTFTVQLPDQMGTKAYGDEASTQATINRLYVEVYSQDGETLVYEPSVITMDNATAKVTLNLVSTQKYDIIFWAQNEFCTYNVNDLTSVKMNANHHNSETGAAFYAVLNDYTPVNGQQGVTLTRPFAQLNLATTTEVSYANGTNNKVTIESAKITVKGVAPSFDRINGQTNGEGYAPALSNEVTYTYENTDATTNFSKAAGEIEVAGKKYQYVSMDYFAVPGNQSTVQVTAEIKVKDPNGVESTITRVIENVPVQLNYKTNIVGNLITSATEFEVIVEEGWAGTNDKEVEFRDVANQEELQKAIDDDVDNITLVDDIELTGTLVFGTAPIPGQGSIARASESVEDEDFVLDLNGKTITTAWENESAGKHYYAFTNYANLVVKNGIINARGTFNYGKLIIEDGTTIKAIDGNGGYAVRNYEGSEFIMNGGTVAATYEDGDAPEPGNYDATPIRVDAGAEAVINGGNVNNVSNFTFAIDNAGTTTINGGTITSVHTTVANYATMTINGGEFSCNGLEGITAHVLWGADGIVEINGGSFDGKDNYNGFNVCASAGSSVIIKGGEFLPVHSGSLYGEGTITVSGGTFFDEPSEKRLAEGYRISIKDDWYEVEPITVEVSTADELVAALENNQNVIFANDITIAATKGGYNKAGILQDNAQTINGAGYTLTVTGAGATWDCAIYTNGGTIKNLTVAGAMRGIFTAGQSSDLQIENVEFKNVIYTFNSDGKMPKNPFGVYVSKSTINGWTSHSDMHTEVVYTNCSFGKGSGYAFCRPYGPTSFVGCDFVEGFEVDARGLITFENCTIGGVALTNENLSNLVTSNTANASVK